MGKNTNFSGQPIFNQQNQTHTQLERLPTPFHG